MSGFLYFIQCGCEHGPIKIGSTTDVEARRSTLQVGSPYPLTILSKAWFGGDVARLEHEVHDLLRDHWIRGEWFGAVIRPFALEVKRLVDLEWAERVRGATCTVVGECSDEDRAEFIEQYEVESADRCGSRAIAAIRASVELAVLAQATARTTPRAR